ncbi:MAG TPA: hypothetical protein VMV43_00420 [Candidatus Nanopelagicaceae bacterium]|nr:hypothetical protein [Candidatus Nanopelagicaceae bacterium]
MENPRKDNKKPTIIKNSPQKSNPKFSREKNKNQKKSLTKKKKNIVKSNLDISTVEDVELGIPLVPESPKKKNKLTINSPGLSADLLQKLKRLESDNIKVVLVNCERCREIIPVPIPKNYVIKSDLPVVPISYVHSNSHMKDQHCITLHLDHDFDIRRQRISDVVFSPE